MGNDREVRAYAWCFVHPESQNSAPYQIHRQRAEMIVRERERNAINSMNLIKYLYENPIKSKVYKSEK